MSTVDSTAQAGLLLEEERVNVFTRWETRRWPVIEKEGQRAFGAGERSSVNGWGLKHKSDTRTKTLTLTLTLMQTEDKRKLCGHSFILFFRVST